jgi:hypothetical protein
LAGEIAIRQPTSHVSTYNLCFDMYVRIMRFQGRSKRLSSRLPQGFDSPVKLYTTWSGPMNTRHLQLGALGGTLSWTTEVCTGKSNNALTPGRKGFLSYDQSGSFLGGQKRIPAFPGLASLLGCHSYWCTPPYLIADRRAADARGIRQLLPFPAGYNSSGD